MEESREMWSSLLKAALTWADNDTKDKGVITCAQNLVKLLNNLAGVYTMTGNTPESEAVLREALQVSLLHLHRQNCNGPATAASQNL